MLCDYRGVVACEYICKKFMYDPLKHIPAQSPVLKPENADPLPSLDDFNDIDDSQNSEAALEKDADTVKSGASSNIREKELKDIRSGDSTENDDIESVEKNAINDRELLDQLAEIDRQYNLLQRDFAEYTASSSDEIQTDNISDAFSNVFSKDNDADMKENPEDTDSEDVYKRQGMRIATVSSPPVTASGMQFFFGRMNVIGPGIKRFAIL